MSNEKQCFVSLAKYKADIANFETVLFYARSKFARIDKEIMSLIGSLDHYSMNDVRLVLENLLRDERPDVAGAPYQSLDRCLDSVKFSSIADGVQTHFEFEGER